MKHAMLPVGIVTSMVGIFLGPRGITYAALFPVGVAVLVELLMASDVGPGGKLGGYIIAAVFIPIVRPR